MKLKDKVAIVTASTKGIGLATAIKLAEAGAIVYLAARNQVLANEIINQHPYLKLKYVNFDATNDASLTAMVEDVYINEKRIDILVNNYGGGNPSKDGTIFDTAVNDYLKIFNDNLKSVFVTSQAVANKMKLTGGGSIINVSTIGSITPDISRIAYVTSKAAINALTQNIAVHGGKFNIRCNAVLPGLTNTDAVKNNMPEEFVDLFLKVTPLNRAANPDDIANAILFFASDEASYITGQILAVAGGFGGITPLYGFFNKDK